MILGESLCPHSSAISQDISSFTPQALRSQKYIGPSASRAFRCRSRYSNVEPQRASPCNDDHIVSVADRYHPGPCHASTLAPAILIESLRCHVFVRAIRWSLSISMSLSWDDGMTGGDGMGWEGTNTQGQRGCRESPKHVLVLTGELCTVLRYML